MYRARDGRLAREVALKVLPARLAEDGEALARFEREARAVAALSHPNILSIFDFGRHEGLVYAVTELLEGESLRERVSAGALPARKAAEYALQVAHGLAAAHEKGIVHRDLKPDNVFVTRDGRVKVLDFGLARQAEAGTSGDDSASPTEAHHTDPGTLLGTVGYMSPEQVRGKAVDHRSDIFSLGSVLYEMVTGERAFRRDTAAETMTAILREDPLEAAEPTSRSGRLPLGLERILRHCLEKNPEERFQSARDLAFDLEALSGSTTERGAAVPGGIASRWRVPPLVAGVASLALVALGFALGRLGREGADASASPPQATFAQLTYQSGVLSYPGVSPDGTSFAFVGEEGGDLDIHLQRVGGTNPINLTADSTSDDSEPAFSPDGSQIALRSTRDGGGLFLMGATGESVRRLTDVGHNPAWSPDGAEIVYSTERLFPYSPYGRFGFGELWAVSVASGEKRQITRGGPVDAVQPSWSPHGQRIAFWGLRSGGQRDLWTVSRTGSDSSIVAVTDDPALDWNPVWSPDGRWLYFASDRGGTMGLWRVAIDEASGNVRGGPEPLTVPSPFACYFSVTRDGQKMLMAGLTAMDSIDRVALNPAALRALGPATPVFASSLRLFGFGVSADGRWITLSSAGRQEDLYTLQRDGTGLRQLTNDPFKDRGPVFFPDGGRIVFFSNRSGQYEAWSVRPDGSGLTQLTRTTGDEVTNPVLSPDGSLLAFQGNRGSLLSRLGGSKEPSAPEPLPPPAGGAAFLAFTWSRDGRRLAGDIQHPSGRRTLAIYSLESKSYQSFDVEGSNPAWVNDDRGLLFSQKGKLMGLDLGSGRVHEVVVPASATGARASDPIAGFDLPRDQRTLFVLRSRSHADIWQIMLQ